MMRTFFYSGVSLVVAALAMLTSGVGASGQGPDGPATDQRSLDFFESKIRPVLIQHCYECHSAESGTAEGGLRLDTHQGMLEGGDRGPALVAGEPAASLLLQAMAHAGDDLQMPPKQDRLSEAVLSDFRRWIRSGAIDPRQEDDPPPPSWGGRTEEHWAFTPISDPPLPQVNDSSWPLQDLDRFVIAQLETSRLETSRLEPSPTADADVLLRRLHFDLVGLPPSPEAIDAFTEQVAQLGFPQAWQRETDRLLDSPRFGERWGRHWLDVARYAESSGKEANISFPHAWRYRDYVIDCFNRDLPFDRFLTEQIAGDLLPYESETELARLLIATGFLAIGAKNLDEMNADQFTADLVDEQIDTLSRAVLGASIACARCHDHKFDPYSMEDYYALAGIFHSTETLFGTAVSPANRIGGDPLPLPRLDHQSVFHQSIPAARVHELKDELASLQQERRQGRAAVMRAVLRGEDPGEIFTLRDALRNFWRTGAVEGQLEKVDEQGQAIPLAMGVLDRKTVAPTRLLHRGDVKQPGEIIPRSVPQAIPLSDLSPEETAAGFAISEEVSGRRQLAQWLTHPGNPLTPRVYVNRVWHHLMGIGLVRTVDNFGSTGEPPSHPELLDHLATRFRDHDWSTKKLVRQIVLSRTYQQASEFRDDAFRLDPENRLRWRMSKRRLEAEAIRDAMLVASGEIDLQPAAGSLVATTIGDGPIALVGLNRRLPDDLDGSRHRSVYLPVLRDRLPDVLELFDAANPSFVTGERETTSGPLQALYLLNSDFVRGRSQALARRLIDERSSTEARLRLAIKICYARPPAEGELARLSEFLRAASKDADAHSAWTDLCQALLATGEFRSLD